MSISDIENMDGDQFEEWKAYFRTRLFTHDLIDFVGAQISLVIAKTMGGAKKAQLKQFLMTKHKYEKTVAQMEAEFRAATS